MRITVGEQVLSLIREKPGITARELSDRLGKGFTHINGECRALENTKRITADRSAQPRRYYAVEDAPMEIPQEPHTPGTLAEPSPFVSEFEEIILNVTSAAGRRLDAGYEIIDRGVPHTPGALKRGKMGVYTFLYQDEFLKIGKAGPNSYARFSSQHYHPDSAMSNLAKSILEDERMQGLGITRDNVGDWIRQNTRRIDVILDNAVGIFALELIEAAFHYRYEPRYEGFKNQR